MPRRWLHLWCALAACRPDEKPPADLPGETAADSGGAGSAPASRIARRLSVAELRNTVPLVTGVAAADALGALMPDATDDGYDRIASSQTISLAHLEAFEGVADAIARDLLTDAAMDELTPACPDAILPPWTASTTVTLPATGFAGSPDWSMSVEDDHVYFLYSDTVTVTTTYGAPAGGTYRVTIPVNVESTRKLPHVVLSVDGAPVQAWDAVAGEQDFVAEFTVADAASVALQLDLAPGDVGWSERGLEIYDATVEGPIDAGAGVYTAERQACVDGLIPVLGERAWRRPPTDTEVARLQGVWAAGLDGGTAADGFRMVVEAIFLSPSFLYLVEVGVPVEGQPGVYRLDDYEQASRLSYALCESPPDDALYAAARAGELRTADQIEAQARRLLDAPCGHTTLARFHRQWLHLDGLDSLARDPAYYAGVTPALGTAMREDTEYFLDRMVYDEHAGLQAEWEATYAWVGPTTAPLYGLTATADHTRVDLPEDRAGPLTQPALLAATSKFSETSPVLRGVYVLEQLLCERLLPPPADLNITPPALDDDMTTRERYEAHSSDPACSGCHDRIDPIGFALEGYDALGRTRTEENGIPIDTSGGVPDLGVDGLTGGRAVAEVIAGSGELRHCFARQWARFGLGQVEDEAADADLLDAIDASSESSIHDALLELVRSDSFMVRVVPEEVP